jgi:site-specific DNA recombinase
MPELDSAVLGHLAERLFTPHRLQIILEAYVARSAEADAARGEELARARRARTEAEGRISRLLELVEQGLMHSADPALKERLDTAKREREGAVERVRLLEAGGSVGAARITPDSIERLSASLRDALRSQDPSFRKAYLRLFLDEVVVGDDAIRLRGPKAALAKATLGDGLPPAAGVVPSFVRQWRPVRDSNPCRRRERAVS